jgi:hypothetical protein
MIGTESVGRRVGNLNYGYFNDKYPTKEAKRRMALALLLPDMPADPPISPAERTNAQMHSAYASRPSLALLWGEEPVDHRRLAAYYATLGHTADRKRGETVMLFRGLDPHLVAAKRAELPEAGFSVDIARLSDAPAVGNVYHQFAKVSPEAAAKRGLAGATIINLHTILLTSAVQRLSVDACGQIAVTETTATQIEVHSASVNLEKNEELYQRSKSIRIHDGVVFGNAPGFRLLRQTVSLVGDDYRDVVNKAIESANIQSDAPLPDLSFLNDVAPYGADERVLSNLLDIDALLDENAGFMQRHGA